MIWSKPKPADLGYRLGSPVRSLSAFDRGAKFAHYRLLDSLREYVLIEPERSSIDVFRRNAEGSWVLHPIGEGDELRLTSLDFRCPITAVYEDVELG